MNCIGKPCFVGVLFLSLLALALPSRAQEKSESALIQDLSSPRAGVVTSALQKLEKGYPLSTNALPTMKKLLTDPRPEVRRKAGRVLGTLHSEVDDNDVKAICAMLKASDEKEIIDALKSLRGLKAPQAVPEIVALLKDSRPNVVRDSCRTLAVLGHKDLIPTIEPLLGSPNPAVQKDANDAIAMLRDKP